MSVGGIALRCIDTNQVEDQLRNVRALRSLILLFEHHNPQTATDTARAIGLASDLLPHVYEGGLARCMQFLSAGRRAQGLGVQPGSCGVPLPRCFAVPAQRPRDRGVMLCRAAPAHACVTHPGSLAAGPACQALRRPSRTAAAWTSRTM